MLCHSISSLFLLNGKFKAAYFLQWLGETLSVKQNVIHCNVGLGPLWLLSLGFSLLWATGWIFFLCLGFGPLFTKGQKKVSEVFCELSHWLRRCRSHLCFTCSSAITFFSGCRERSAWWLFKQITAVTGTQPKADFLGRTNKACGQWCLSCKHRPHTNHSSALLIQPVQMTPGNGKLTVIMADTSDPVPSNSSLHPAASIWCCRSEYGVLPEWWVLFIAFWVRYCLIIQLLMDLGSQFQVGMCSEVSFVLVGRFLVTVAGIHSEPGWWKQLFRQKPKKPKK